MSSVDLSGSTYCATIPYSSGHYTHTCPDIDERLEEEEEEEENAEAREHYPTTKDKVDDFNNSTLQDTANSFGYVPGDIRTVSFSSITSNTVDNINVNNGIFIGSKKTENELDNTKYIKSLLRPSLLVPIMGDVKDSSTITSKSNTTVNLKKNKHRFPLFSFRKKRSSKQSKQSSCDNILVSKMTETQQTNKGDTLELNQEISQTSESSISGSKNSNVYGVEKVSPTVSECTKTSHSKLLELSDIILNNTKKKSAILVDENPCSTSQSNSSIDIPENTVEGINDDNSSMSSIDTTIEFSSDNASMFQTILNRLAEEYNDFNEKLKISQKLYDSTLVINKTRKQQIPQLIQENEKLEKEVEAIFQKSIKYQYLKLETSDITTRKEALLKRLEEKDTVLGEYRKQYDNLKVVKEQLKHETESALIEALHSKKKLNQLSDIVKDLDCLQEEDMERRLYFNKLQSAQGDVRVFFRVKPTNEPSCISYVTSTKIRINFDKAMRKHPFAPVINSASSKQCVFTRVFEPLCKHEDIFEELSSLADSVIDGYSASVVAYGQTGSGKTYTMFGNDSERTSNPGVTERIFSQILTKAKLQKHWLYRISVSAFELYRQKVYDLLRGCQVVNEETGNQIILRNTEECLLDEQSQIGHLIQRILSQRHVGPSRLNTEGSRGHTVITIRVEGHNHLNTRRDSHGALMLCDTAGFDGFVDADSVSLSAQVYNNFSRRNLSKINRANLKGLTALKKVLEARREGENAKVLCEDSTLTQILRPCIIHPAKCILLITGHSSKDQAEYTLRAAQFGMKVRPISKTKNIGTSRWILGESHEPVEN